MKKAFLSTIPGYIIFTLGDKRIKFACSDSLQKILSIKKWHEGYIVVDAKYADDPEPEEEYIDMRYILNSLYIDPKQFLQDVSSVEVAYD